MAAKQPRFVYIENHIDSRNIMQILLVELLGYCDLIMFEDSKDIVQRLKALGTPIDVLFVDIDIEPSDGFTILEELRKHDSFANTKIVAITASFLPDELDRIAEVGFDGLIGKPLDDETFPGQITSLLNGEYVWSIN
jgi:CheY-like chemotaxis protein